MRQYKLTINTRPRNLYEIEVTRHGDSVFHVSGIALIPGMELANKMILEDLGQDPLEDHSED